MNFSVSSVQPVLGHLSQSAGNSQSAVGDSAIPPRKAVESDSFEKQSKPASGTVVPTVVATAVLSPVLGALAGEGVWRNLASEEKGTITPVPTGASGAGKGSKPRPSIGNAEDKVLQESRAKLSLLQEYIKEMIPVEDIKPFVAVDTLSCSEINTEIETLLKTHQKAFTKSLWQAVAIGKYGDNSSNANYFQASLDFIEATVRQILGVKSVNPQIDEALAMLHSEVAKKQLHFVNNQWDFGISPLGNSTGTKAANWNEIVTLLKNVVDKKTRIDNDLLTKAERYGYALERNSYLHGMFDEQFILESLESSDPNIAFLNNQLQQANAMFFERIVEKQLGLPTPAIDISPVEVVEAVDAVASSTTQTVETSMKEGVQSIQGFGNWMLKSTEALQKTGGEALEKHAITSRWVAGGVAAVTLLVGSCVAYTISKFKPEKSVTSNTR